MKTEVLLFVLEFVNRALVVALGGLVAMLCTVYVLTPFLEDLMRSTCR